MVKERPILFSAPMVRAILEGRKTQTRRVLKHQGLGPKLIKQEELIHRCRAVGLNVGAPKLICCPYGQAGDRLWVRETWADLRGKGFDRQASFAADTLPGSDGDEARKAYGIKWKPSIHMPRWASRITLEITGVRVERLQEISDADARAEGVPTSCQYAPDEPREVSARWQDPDGFARDNFQALWNSLHGSAAWGLNPWVWVIQFKRVGA